MVAGLGMYGSMPQMNQMYGNTKQTGSVFMGLQQRYGCPDCFQDRPYFVQYPVPVQQVPVEVVKPSLLSRIVSTFLGG